MMYPPTSKLSATCAGYFNENEARIVREELGGVFGKIDALILKVYTDFFKSD
jgi:hypothetical protein